MVDDRLKIDLQPTIRDGTMVLAFSGWMNGGDVSTGTVEWLSRTLGSRKVAGIDPEGFYIYSFPGDMQVSAEFRPHTRIEEGIVQRYRPPINWFCWAQEQGLLLFRGKEPHFNWREFADCLFTFAVKAGVSLIYFIGSFGGVVPHTREPRLTSACSDERLKPRLEPFVTSFANYQGPASFSTYLLTEARKRDIDMASLVAEIPAYIQGTNPKSIEAVIRKLVALLGLQLELDRLRAVSDEWEKRLNDALESEHVLVKYIQKLEEDYDNQVFDTQMEDLKEWLEERGVRVD